MMCCRHLSAKWLLIFSMALVISAEASEKILYSYKTSPARETKPFAKASSENGMNFLAIRPAKDDFSQGIYQTLLGAGENEEWRNCEIDFKFRFPEKIESLSIGIKDASDPKNPSRHLENLSYNRWSLYVSSPNFLPSQRWSAYLPGLTLKEKTWYRGLVRINEKSISGFMELDGKMVRFVEGIMPETKRVALNFSANCAVDLANVTVRGMEAKAVGFAEDKGVKTAKSPQRFDIDPKQDCNTTRFSLCPGELPGAQISLSGVLEKPIIMGVYPSNSLSNLQFEKDKPATSCFLNEEKIIVTGLNSNAISRFIKPNIDKYRRQQQKELWEKWNSLPQASKSFVNLEFRQDTSGIELWIDGSYCGRKNGGKLSKVSIFMPSGAAIKDIFTGTIQRDKLFLPLEMAYLANSQMRLDAKSSLPEGLQNIANIPVIVSTPKNSADVGAVRATAGTAADLENSAYLSRTPLDGLPETIHFSVPSKQYIRAYVLCADMQTPGCSPILTTRLTRFARGGRSSDAIADTAVTLPKAGEKLPPEFTNAGELKCVIAGKETTIPVYLAEITLAVGKIQDLVCKFDVGALLNEPYLDFEILGKARLPDYGNHSPSVDDSVKSSVRIFGVSLESSPVDMELRQAQIGNVFQNDEKVELPIALTPHQKSECRLEWNLNDINGKIVETGSKDLSFADDKPSQFVVEPKVKEHNWYGISLNLFSGRRLLLEHKASMALLGKDTRRAGYESPYGQRSASSLLGIPDYRISAVLSHKGGFRRNRPWLNDVDEAKLAEWKIFYSEIPWKGPAFFRDPDPSIGLEKTAREFLEKWPHADTAIIFHESYGGEYFFPELYEQPSPEPSSDTKRLEHQQTLLKIGQIAGKMYREKFPGIRLMFGNSGDSMAIMAMLLRNKFPKEYIDAIGDESLGQTMIPELPEAGSGHTAWFLQELSRKLGYGTLPVDACNEWRGRLSLDLGELSQAEWNVRDMLMAHAYKYRQIQGPDQCDPGTVFYDNEYGSQACMKRYPLLYPKPSYVAAATLTRALDQVKLIREVPSGSGTVYALEFDRRGEYAYAVWMPRGAAELVFDFGKNMKATHIAFLGAEKTLQTSSGKLSMEAGTAANYLISPFPVKSISVAKFKHPAPEASLSVVEKMNDASRWQLDKENKCWERKTRVRGDFELRQVKDEEKGDCLELELIKTNAVHQLIGEYTVLKLKEPVQAAGTPSTIGVWVKGNSSWGDIGWEIEDAEGERFLYTGGYFGRDWPGNCALNFDGWAFVQFPLNANASWPHHIYRSWIDGYWGRRAGNGNKKIDFPIKVSGLIVETRRKNLVLTQMKEIPLQKLRFRDISVY